VNHNGNGACRRFANAKYRGWKLQALEAAFDAEETSVFDETSK
jgi:hypothetical protein